MPDASSRSLPVTYLQRNFPLSHTIEWSCYQFIQLFFPPREGFAIAPHAETLFADQAGLELKRSTCLCLPSVWIKCAPLLPGRAQLCKMWILVLKFRSSCLRGKYFTDWAISRASFPVFFVCSLHSSVIHLFAHLSGCLLIYHFLVYSICECVTVNCSWSPRCENVRLEYFVVNNATN